MGRKQFGKKTTADFKRGHVLDELKKLGVTKTPGGMGLQDCDYAELKWLLALEKVKNEGAG